MKPTKSKIVVARHQDRNLKIVSAISAPHLPHLPLKGRWLERAGFEIGMHVRVIVGEECLVIIPSKSDLGNRE
jgi:hypothetical protein